MRVEIQFETLLAEASRRRTLCALCASSSENRDSISVILLAEFVGTDILFFPLFVSVYPPGPLNLKISFIPWLEEEELDKRSLLVDLKDQILTVGILTYPVNAIKP